MTAENKAEKFVASSTKLMFRLNLAMRKSFSVLKYIEGDDGSYPKFEVIDIIKPNASDFVGKYIGTSISVSALTKPTTFLSVPTDNMEVSDGSVIFYEMVKEKSARYLMKLDATSSPASYPAMYPAQIPSISFDSSPVMSPFTQPNYGPATTPFSSPAMSPFKQPNYGPAMTPNSSPVMSPFTQPNYEPATTPFSSPAMSPFKQPNFEPSTSSDSSPVMSPFEQPNDEPTMPPFSSPVSPSSPSNPVISPSPPLVESPTTPPVEEDDELVSSTTDFLNALTAVLSLCV